MPSDRLYEMLAEAESRPSGAREVLEAALGAGERIGKGYLAAKELEEVLRKRRMGRMSVSDLYGGRPPETVSEYGSVPLEVALATKPLEKDKLTSADQLALMSVINPQLAAELMRPRQPARSDMASLPEEYGSEPQPATVSPPIMGGMSKAGYTIAASAAQKEADRRQREKLQQERLDAAAKRQSERIGAVNARAIAKQKAAFAKAEAGLQGTEVQVDDIFRKYEEIEKEGKVGQLAGLRGRYESARAGLSRGRLPGSDKIFAFQQLADGLIARLRSFTGDVGVLTEQDAVRLRGLLPQIGEPLSVSNAKRAQIKRLLAVARSGNIAQVDALLRQFGIKQMDAPWDLEQRQQQVNQDREIQEPDEVDSLYLEAGF